MIVGGLAAGPSAAAKARRENEGMEIIVFEQTDDISYGTCGLPYFFSNTIKKEEDLLVSDPIQFSKRFQIDLRTFTRVTRIDAKGKKVFWENLETKASGEQSYDKLVFATGAKPIWPKMPGMDAKNIFPMRTLDDLKNMSQYLDSQKPKAATVIGGGLIGLEMAENLAMRGLKVTVIEKAPQILTPMDSEFALQAQKLFEKENVKVITGLGLTEIKTANGLVVGVKLENGHTIESELVVMSIGIVANSDLLKAEGVTTNERGIILVNEKMETNLNGIYAAGDCALVPGHQVTGDNTWLPLGSIANKMGRTAGQNAAGGHGVFKTAAGTMIVKIFENTFAKTGLNEREAKLKKINYGAIVVHVGDHASYYPGAKSLAIKLIYQKNDGLLLGAQVSGEQGVDKRIDVLATALYNKMKVTDLIELDLAYAPPYSSAKDPVIVAGMAASNAVEFQCDPYLPDTLKARLDTKMPYQLIDVRTSAERSRGYIEGSVHIPIDELRDRQNELAKDKEIILYCHKGLRGYVSARFLRNLGFANVKNLSGGFTSWEMYGLPIKN